MPLGTAPEQSARAIRIAWVDGFTGLPVTRDTQSAIADLASKLQQHGNLVEQRAPDNFDFVAAWDTFYKLLNAEFESHRPEGSANQQSKASMTSYAYRLTLARRDELIGALERFFKWWDLFLCPVSSGPEFSHCPTGTPIAVDDRMVPYWEAATHHCLPFALTGHPTIVVPLAKSSEGLPIGVQLVGRRWADLDLLSAAKHLTDIIGPFQRPPGY